MSKFFGRTALLKRIRELHQSDQHIEVVGARAMGKTELLNAVVAHHRSGSELFAGAGVVDLRHDPPVSSEGAIRRVSVALRDVFREARDGRLKDLASEIDLAASPEEMNEVLQLALEEVAARGQRVLLVLDGCDAVLQNSAIPRSLWDNIRALAQRSSLRLMTASRGRLVDLCYSPDARGSDFFGIFYPQPIRVGPFISEDWQDVYGRCGMNPDGSAQKELVNWTGGHPVLVGLLVDRLLESHFGADIGKDRVDAAAESLLVPAAAPIEALWCDCSAESRGDVIRLTQAEMLAGELPNERLTFLVERGIAFTSGNKLRTGNRFIERIASVRQPDVSSARSLFGTAEDFKTNIRTVIDFRVAQIQDGDSELVKLVRRAVRHLPDEPDAALGIARDICDRALRLVWAVEAPDGLVPTSWIEDWKFSKDLAREVVRYADDRRLPFDSRGKQCGLLRRATGGQFLKAVTKKVTKQSVVLIEHVSNLGDLKNHFDGEITLTMGAAFCLTAIELTESLSRDLSQ